MITSTFSSELGDITLTIDDSGATSTGFATKIGTIKYDFDIVGDENTVTSKIVAYNTFNFEMRNLDAVGESLYDRLYSALSSATATIKLEIDVYSTAENWQFAFVLNQSGLELDENTDILKCSCTTFFNTSITVGDVFSNVTNFSLLDIDGTTDAISVGSFINYVIGQFNTSLSSNFLNFAPSGSASFSTYLYELFTNPNSELGTDEVALCLKYDAGVLTENALVWLAYLSILEGGIFGTGFDKNFYVNRISQGTAIEIPENNVLKRSFKPRNPAFAKIELSSGGSGNLVPNPVEYETFIVSSKRMNIISELAQLNKGRRVNGSPPRLDGEYSGYTVADIEPILLNYGLDSIKQSYPVGVTKIVNTEIRDCAKLKVYDSFYFEDTPSEVFRISYAEYDFMSNSVKIIAYQI